MKKETRIVFVPIEISFNCNSADLVSSVHRVLDSINKLIETSETPIDAVLLTDLVGSNEIVINEEDL